MYSPLITIPNPDDEFLPPIFEGDPFHAQDRLIPGIYQGAADYSDLLIPGDPSAESICAVPGVLVVWSDKIEYPSLAWREGSGSVWIDHEPDAYSLTDDGYPVSCVPSTILSPDKKA